MMRKATTPVIVAVVLVLALFVGANAQAVATNFSWVVTKLLTVTDTATFTSGVNVAGTLAASGGLDAAGTTVDTLIVEGNGDVVGNFAELINASDGQLLILVNTSANTITITETAAAVMAGNFAMGQGDSLTLMGNGVVWYELSRSNN